MNHSECRFCGKTVVDAREVAGSKRPAWASIEPPGIHDFGCLEAPESTPDVSAPHEAVD